MANFTFGNETLYPNATYGISIDQSEIYQTPEKDYEFVEIPGMSGSLLFDNNRFKNITIPVNCFIRSDFPTKFRSLTNYLLSVNGYQKLTLPQDSGHFRMGAFRKATKSETGSFNKSGKFTLEFECKPQRYLDSGDSWYFPSSNTTINNQTRFTSKPLIRFYGNGTVRIGSYQITVAGRGANTYIQIDCETMTCTNGSTNLSSYVTLSNGYPELPPGQTTVTYTTDSTSQRPFWIKYRWWEL